MSVISISNLFNKKQPKKRSLRLTHDFELLTSYSRAKKKTSKLFFSKFTEEFDSSLTFFSHKRRVEVQIFVHEYSIGSSRFVAYGHWVGFRLF